MILGDVHRSLGICLTAEENPRKTSARRSSMKAVGSVIASNGVPYLQMRSVGSHSTSGREKEANRDRATAVDSNLKQPVTNSSLAFNCTCASRES